MIYKFSEYEKKWYKIKILDLYDCKWGVEKFKGKWETYIPTFHLFTWNVAKK